MLFTDIEGSTRLLGQLGERYASVLHDYHRLLVESAAAHGGSLVDTAGDGAFFTYPTATAALQAAIAAQLALLAHEWPDSVTVRARMGLHTGEALNVDERYVGMDVHRAARITAAGHGGQVLLSRTARDLLGSSLPNGVTLRDLGEHRLKDLPEPERVFQAVSPDLPSDFPPLRSLDAWPNNLPRQLSSFVGRTQALLNVDALLGAGPLLTLTGPGGVGKTRLALEVAAQAADRCPDGAWLIDLAALVDGQLVRETLASTLKVKEQPGIELTDTLVAQIGRKRLLLIIDNCEHVLEATAELVDTLLHACAEVRVLATSQEALGIAGETVYPVPSMALTAAEGVTFDEIANGDAARLFVERARSVEPTFRLTEANARSVAQICARLDGIPLAIELAAARVRALPVDQIATRLNDRFRLLTGGARMALPRHRTLQAAVDWSYELLTEAERELFGRLSIFPGSFSLETVELVCAGDGIDRDDILDLLTRLIDRSLVTRFDVDGEARYQLLQSLRQYAAEKLEERGGTLELQRRHRDHFAALVDEARPAFFAGPEPVAWVERLSLEHDSLRAALTWGHDDPAGAAVELQMAAGLWRYWQIRGYLAEGRQTLERALSRTAAEVSDVRASALTGAGVLAAQQGDQPGANAALEASLSVLRSIGNNASIAAALSNTASVVAELGDLDRARRLYEEALTLTRQTGESRGTASSLLNLADIVAQQDRAAEAQDAYDEALNIFHAAGDRFGVAIALGRGATISLRQGDLVAARARYEEALDIYRGFGDRRGVARTLMHLGDLLAQEGDREAANLLYRQSLAERQQVDDRIGTSVVLGRLAGLAVDQDPPQAARLLGAAAALRAAVGASLSARDAADEAAMFDRLAGAMGAEALRAEVSAGRSAPVAVIRASS